MDMRIAILFNLENGDAIIGNDKGEVGYASSEFLEQYFYGKLSKNSPKVVMASPGADKFIMPIPHDLGKISLHFIGIGLEYGDSDRETVELQKYIAETPSGDYIVRCGYGEKTDTWVIRGVPTKAPPASDHT